MSESALPCILVVEDDQAFRETVTDVLRNVGYKVRGARSLRKATKRLKRHKFDLVLTDVYLGSDSGFDVLQIAHERRPEAKIMVMSSQADPDLIQQALTSGATRFIPKPFRLKELLQAVEESLGNALDQGNI